MWKKCHQVGGRGHYKNTQLMKQRRQNRKDGNQPLLCVDWIKICTNHAFLCVFQPFLQFNLWNRSLNHCALFSLYRSGADCSKFDFVSSLVVLRSLSTPKSRFAQERRAIERFQRAMCPALLLMYGTDSESAGHYFCMREKHVICHFEVFWGAWNSFDL